jgi:hypothetical protein
MLPRSWTNGSTKLFRTFLLLGDYLLNVYVKIGFPVLTVTETRDGIKVRQDRFLETGPAEAKENETIW